MLPALLSLQSHDAEAVIEPIYTLPFYDDSEIICNFGCYSGRRLSKGHVRHRDRVRAGTLTRCAGGGCRMTVRVKGG